MTNKEMHIHDMLTTDIVRFLREERGVALYPWYQVDVITALNGREMTPKQIRQVIHHLNTQHDANVGINWDVIDTVIDLVLEDKWQWETSDGTTFDPQGVYMVSNTISYEVELNRDGDAGRLRYQDSHDRYRYTDWLDIETNEDGDLAIDPEDLNIPLHLIVST